MLVLTLRDVEKSVARLAGLIHGRYGLREYHFVAIPRGGVPVAYLLAEYLRREHGCAVLISLSSDHVRATSGDAKVIAVDDITCTGASMERVVLAGEASSGAVLYAKGTEFGNEVLVAGTVNYDTWVQFPWEQGDADQGKPEDAVRRLIEYLGGDPTEEGFLDTPRRVLGFYDELNRIRDEEITATAFSSTTQDLVVMSGIPFASLCGHHMLPYFGEAAVAYVPHGKILGLSKLARAVQQAAAGLTVQEHLTAQAAEQISDWAESKEVAVVTTAVHSCMVIRGVRALGARASASTMLGKFRESAALRAEFFAIADQAKSLA